MSIFNEVPLNSEVVYCGNTGCIMISVDLNATIRLLEFLDPSHVMTS